MKACNRQRKAWMVDYGYFWSLSALSRVAATLFLSPALGRKLLHVFMEQLVCGWWGLGWAAKTLSSRYWGICVWITYWSWSHRHRGSCCCAPPIVEHPSLSSSSGFQGVKGLVPFPPPSLLSFSPFGSQIVRHSKANAYVEEIRKSPCMPREGYRFRKDLRPKVDTSANRHPTIKKTKASKPQEGEESDFQGCNVQFWTTTTKAQWIQRSREVEPISREKK